MIQIEVYAAVELIVLKFMQIAETCWGHSYCALCCIALETERRAQAGA
jgi:hypothetical protein